MLDKHIDSVQEQHVKCFLLLWSITHAILSPEITVEALGDPEAAAAEYSRMFVMGMLVAGAACYAAWGCRMLVMGARLLFQSNICYCICRNKSKC